MFNKETYWKNRKAGKRGQGDDSVPTVTKTNGPSTRKRDRQKLVDRKKTKKGFEYGVRIGTRVYNSLKTAQKRFIGENFGKLIITDEKTIKTSDGKTRVHKTTKYVFPPKSRHKRSVSEGQLRHFAKQPVKPQGTNKERHQARRDERNKK